MFCAHAVENVIRNSATFGESCTSLSVWHVYLGGFRLLPEKERVWGQFSQAH